jgi:hypothetical protein
MFGGWPHEIAEFPFSYYRVLRDYFLFDQDRKRKAMDRNEDDPFADAPWDAEVVKTT